MQTEKTVVAALEAQLNDFDNAARVRALEQLRVYVKERPPKRDHPVANMHCHSFYSYNASGRSPTALAWLARQQSIDLMGIVDFDTLDGVDEFLTACDALDVRGSAGMETRTYIPEFAAYVTNSVGEPGIYYHMGIGFTSSKTSPVAAPILETMHRRALERNLNIISRLNDFLAPVAIDYEQDVLPLTPGGNAIERHIILAYVQAAQRMVDDIPAFWASKLDMSREEVERLLVEMAQFQNMLRVRLMKRGGVGYIQPNPETFPTVEEFHSLVTACGAIPTATWLDGLSDGEQRTPELLDLLIGKGAAALNLIPDRNWNVADPDLRAVKVRNLHEVVALAADLDLPLNIGTEMNSFGLKIVDDFDAPALLPVRDAFLDGAYFIYGHTVAQRSLGLGYQSDWVAKSLPTRRERNRFYMRLGQLVEPGRRKLLTRLCESAATMTPDDLLSAISKIVE